MAAHLLEGDLVALRVHAVAQAHVVQDDLALAHAPGSCEVGAVAAISGASISPCATPRPS
jgi:hypothetical protein